MWLTMDFQKMLCLCNQFIYKPVTYPRNLLFFKTSTKYVILQTSAKCWRAEDCEPPSRYDDIDLPEEARGLKSMAKAPDHPPVDRRRKNYLIRGPSIGEDAELKLGQFGIIALKGGFLKHGNFNLIQQKINRAIKRKPLYAEWRVKSPYLPRTKHPIQAVMGGGKGSIDHYVTPVKSRQVIVEVAGKAQFIEIYPTLRMVAMLMPMPALAVHKQMLQDIYDEEHRIEDENENFFTFRELVEKNMQGIRSKITMYDYRHFGKMR